MTIELRNVTKTFGAARALDEVSLRIEPGQIVALLGANAAGKTTLLRCLAGLVRPSHGTVHYDGQIFRRDLIELRRRFFFLPDFPYVFEDWPVLRHIGMTLRLYQAGLAGVEERVLELLRELDLLPVAEIPFEKLSRGQRYKGALAALLAVDPELWMLDEPFASGMDPHAIQFFRERAQDAASRGRTVIYTTQILDVAERFCDRVCVIHHGRVRAFETMSRLHELAGSGHGVLDDLFKKLRLETGS